MISHKLFVISSVFALAALVGCAAEPAAGEGEPTETAGADLSALPKVVGSFVSAGSETLGLPKNLTFAAGGTYRSASAHGSWTLAKVGSQLKITLDASDAAKKTYFFSLSGNTMTFNETLSGATAYFYDESWHKKIPIGGLCEDGHGHSLGECSDSGNFACGEFDNVMTCNPLD
jgi:hypothetical protein